MNEEIKKALQILQKGGVILYPTDTIWGIGCDATNEEAVAKIYKIKQREDSKAMLVLLDDAQYLQGYMKEVPEIAYTLIEVADKPTTIIYDNAQRLASNIIDSDGSVGIRITNDEFCKKLIAKFGKPIVSTSANISGKANALTFSEISDEIKQAVDYVVNWRQNDKTKSKPSSIIKLRVGGEIKIIRS